MKKTGYQIVFLLCTFYGLSESYSITIKCSLPSPSIDFDSTEIDFSLNRDNITIYTYPNTTSVNMVLGEAQLIFKHTLKKNKTQFHVSTIRVAALGVGNKIDNYIKDCNFFVAHPQTEAIFSSYEEQYHLSKTCLNDIVCRLFPELNEKNFKTAESEPRDFGPISLLSSRFLETNKKLHPPCAYIQDPILNVICNIDIRFKKEIIKEKKGLLNFIITYDDPQKNQKIEISGVNKYILNLENITKSIFSKAQGSFQYFFQIPVVKTQFTLQNLKRKPTRYIPNPNRIRLEFYEMLFRVNISFSVLPIKECDNILYELKRVGDPDTSSYVYNSLGDTIPLINVDEVKKNTNQILDFIESKIYNVTKEIVENYDCTVMMNEKIHV